MPVLSQQNIWSRPIVLCTSQEGGLLRPSLGELLSESLHGGLLLLELLPDSATCAMSASTFRLLEGPSDRVGFYTFDLVF